MDPPQIKVTAVSMVTPALPPPTHRMFLTNFDLLWLPINSVRILLFYTISQGNEYFSVVEKLKNSLSWVLVHFYPLAGRLTEGESGRPEIDCISEGVEFIEASANIPFEDLEKEGFEHKPYFTNLAPTMKPVENGNYSTPLLSVQVTSFEGGSGICMGITHHHVLADGTSFWHFMKSWGECSRGLIVSNPPVHNRKLLKVEDKTLLPLSFKPHPVPNDEIMDAQIFKFLPDASQSGQHKILNSFAEGDRRRESIKNWQHQNQPLKYSTFHFAEEVIQQLKQRTKASTSFIALAAHFWRSMVKAREIPEEELVHFTLFADCRARLTPSLPSTYFGNCLTIVRARTTTKKLLREDAAFAAQLIKEAITTCTAEEQIKNMIQWLECPGNSILTTTEDVARGYSTNVVGSMRLPVDEVDYGWGKPLNSQMAAMNEIGGMVLFGRSEEFGDTVSTCLPSNMMENLRALLQASGGWEFTSRL